VLRSEVEGRVLMKAFLSGLPTCRLGLNMHGQDCTFASIVSQREWETAKCISFVPPDNGNKTEFEVMRYRLSDHIKPPFRVTPQIVESGRTRVSVRIALASACHLHATPRRPCVCTES
jgi:AP-2 complex subunit mu-1